MELHELTGDLTLAGQIAPNKLPLPAGQGIRGTVWLSGLLRRME